MAFHKLREGSIRAILDSAFREFHNHYHRHRDPVDWVHRYEATPDRELVAFFSAALAYGNVRMILRNQGRFFEALGPHPIEGLFQKELGDSLRTFSHRFTKGIDLEIVCWWLREALERKGSLETFFLSSSAGGAFRDRVAAFVNNLTALPLPNRLKKALTARRRNVEYLIPNPLRGSSCKRLNLFFRWVVRPADGIDLGLWSRVEPRELLLPVDTHVLRVIRELGWTKSKAARWSTAEEATAHLRRFCPEDPVRYDFSLCHLSMSGFTLAKYYAQMER